MVIQHILAWTLICLNLTFSLGGLAANTLVIWLLSFRLRRNPFCVYILNLAAADCILLGITFVYFLMSIIDYYHSVRISYHIFIYMISFPYLTSMSLLSAIGTERCLCILCPIWYRCHRPGYMSAVMCILLWALSLMLTFLDWIYCEEIGILCQASEFFISAWLIFLFVVLCGSSLLLLVKVFYGAQRRKMTRFIMTILITVLVYLLCGLPLGISWFLLSWFPIKLYALLYIFFQFLSCVNSSANPIIYFFVGSFRQQRLKPTLRMVLQRALQDTPEEDEPGGAPTSGTHGAESSVV
ncbi:mas-related G-protein coupled receptor member X1-like [Echinops telfairi]|uniref:Mas-related G-protein coupled receptor member X1-like n=1 Tax=Echinops telfairi TaxID=9371 RepID=A0ABM1VK70_ECHTE|nr:mas-related G-protein coupled receptor member X1-like [Echinops telfairi]